MNGKSIASALVAVALFGLIGWVSTTAINRYETADEALKFWSAMSAVIGVAVGAIPSYFFGKSAVRARNDADSAQEVADVRLAALAEVFRSLDAGARKELEANPVVDKALGLSE